MHKTIGTPPCTLRQMWVSVGDEDDNDNNNSELINKNIDGNDVYISGLSDQYVHHVPEADQVHVGGHKGILLNGHMLGGGMCNN